MIICAHCNNEINDTKYKTLGKKRYHYHCYDALINNKEKEDKTRQDNYNSDDRSILVDYILQTFNISKLPYLIEKQIEDYTSKLGYSFSGIYKTLYYFYTLQNNNVDSEISSIGIVPYVYEEAKSFYEMSHQANQYNNEQELKMDRETIRITPPNRFIKCDVDIEKL